MISVGKISKKLKIGIQELEDKISKLGFEIKNNEIEDEIAELVIDEFRKDKGDKAIIYQEIFEREREKEIIKSQRKKTAGKSEPVSKSKKTKKPDQIKEQPTAVKKTEVEIPEIITVKEFAEKTGLPPVKIIGELMKNGILANINQQIDFETASILASDFGIRIKRKRSDVSLEDLMSSNLEALVKEDDENELKPRPPIVTVMGHVDHGKSKLLETIRDVEMLSLEAGGITQHIGAYQVEKNGKKITFLDTPGHEAFTAMRARGAKVTDIAILVVAADEGVKPQTTEALNHAKDAGVPIIVAINKIDKEGANVDRVKAQLAELGLQPEDWGGKTIMVPVSAATGEGIPALLDMILLIAEMENLRGNPKREGVASVIEAHLDKNLGPVATVVVNTGTLRTGNHIIVGACFGKIKLMKDHLGKSAREALPSTPVQIVGLSGMPLPGDILQVISSDKEAREKAFAIANIRKGKNIRKGEILQSIMAQIASGKLKTLKIVLKADTNGSLEAIKNELSKVKHEEVSIKIIHFGIGDITETDIMMAKASGGVVIGFQTSTTANARHLADTEGVHIFIYAVIYKLLEDIKNLLAGLLEPEIITIELGKAEVKKIFFTGKKEMIVGCKIIEGKLETKASVRIIRSGKNIGEGIVNSLRKVDENVTEIGEGHECGVKITTAIRLEEGDVLEGWKQETKKRGL